MKEEVYVERAAIPAAVLKRVSWGAIFAGLFVGMVIQITLTLLGAAIGLGSIEPLKEENPTKGLALGSAIWLLVSGLVSTWIGACIAGRLSGGPRRSDGLIHGIVTWSVATCVTLVLLATTAGAILGGTASLLGGALSVGNNASGNQQGSVQEQVKALFPQTGALLPPTGRSEGAQPPGRLTELAQQDAELSAALARMESHGGAAKASADKEQVVNLLTSKHGLDQAEATTMVEQWDQQFQQLRGQVEQKTREAGDVAARGLSKGALWGFVGMILGLLVAAWGGWAGTASLPRYDEPAPAT